MSTIILDIDNCIADDSWRIPNIDWQQPDLMLRYHKYHSLSGMDPVGNHDLIHGTQHDIVVFTARPNRYRALTEFWLKSNGVNCRHLLMRNDDDHCHSSELKQKQLRWLLSEYDVLLEDIVAAYDDRQDVIDMYVANGIHAERRFIHDVNAYAPARRTVTEILHCAAETYEQRNALYGDNYKRFGHVMTSLFPEGLTVSAPEDWNRLGLVVQQISKVTRYAANFSNGGHKDSAHDACVYSAMLEELTRDSNNI